MCEVCDVEVCDVEVCDVEVSGVNMYLLPLADQPGL